MEQFQYLMRLCSLFMQYPDQDWVGNREVNEILDFLDDGDTKKLLLTFNGYLSEHPIHELCGRYVQTFDFNEKTTLYLTYFQYQDHKERGLALLQLKELYQKTGLMMNSTELPDYLPLVLEFLAIAPSEIGAELISSQQENIEKLWKEIVVMESPYRFVLEAIISSTQSMIQTDHMENIGGSLS
ncbi:nitrate reductase molybdenum cofactor assembly chaperone [Tepidibacillus marianensis]|uniref:nitrate reductase molybdenum cofactor assembly chaperone n=1 Tax=Tepidibacillus marianensis TaxID=3131995 RepID=UPI0030D1F6D6